jgi:uncharacterized LabA/DUF88 family protein
MSWTTFSVERGSRAAAFEGAIPPGRNYAVQMRKIDSIKERRPIAFATGRRTGDAIASAAKLNLIHTSSRGSHINTKNRKKRTRYDGFNLYYGIRDKEWKKYYWLDVQKLVKHLLKNHQTLECAKYFTSRIIDNPRKQKRQNTFLEALMTLTEFKMFFGKYIINRITCSKCNFVSHIPNEKMTDVNIATEMMTDAFQDRFDTALLISADSDLKSPLEAIKNLFTEADGVSLSFL